MSDMIELCGLWKSESKAGNRYLSGKLGNNVTIMIFENTRKSKDSEPDFRLMIAPQAQKGGGTQHETSQRESYQPQRSQSDDSPF
jgi:uncharacterized protein (DUF736 family)